MKPPQVKFVLNSQGWNSLPLGEISHSSHLAIGFFLGKIYVGAFPWASTELSTGRPSDLGEDPDPPCAAQFLQSAGAMHRLDGMPRRAVLTSVTSSNKELLRSKPLWWHICLWGERRAVQRRRLPLLVWHDGETASRQHVLGPLFEQKAQHCKVPLNKLRIFPSISAIGTLNQWNIGLRVEGLGERSDCLSVGLSSLLTCGDGKADSIYISAHNAMAFWTNIRRLW